MTDTWLTATLPGTGGTIKNETADFQVDEIPLYPASGSGEYLYLQIEKEGLTTFAVIEALARHCRLKPHDIGYAGLKDARARTRQTLSLPLAAAKGLESFSLPGCTLGPQTRHENKLRTGHLAGNCFRIRIRECQPGAFARAEEILDSLSRTGVPNRFGPQRYGMLGNNHLVGQAILRRDFATAINHIIGAPEAIRNERWHTAAAAWQRGAGEEALAALPPRFRVERQLISDLVHKGKSEEEALLRLPRKLLLLYLSAWQSALFDRSVQIRMDSLERLWPGDIAWKHVNGACFSVSDPAVEQSRAASFEISPTGPMFGRKMKTADKEWGEIEKSLLADELGAQSNWQISKGIRLEGERRPLRVPLTAVTCQAEGDDLLVSFQLPRGSYATTVLAEIMKPKEQDLNELPE